MILWGTYGDGPIDPVGNVWRRTNIQLILWEGMETDQLILWGTYGDGPVDPVGVGVGTDQLILQVMDCMRLKRENW